MMWFSRLRSKIYWYFCNKYEQLSTLNKWMPIAYNDYQHDFSAFYKILRFKLQLMLDDFESQNRGLLDLSDNIKQIQACIDCIDRLLEDDYCRKEYDALYAKYGEIKQRPHEPDENGMIEVDLYYEYAQKEEEAKQARADFAKIYELEGRRRTQDVNDLFNMLKRCHQRWWY